jgi:ankyrin repeat protein
VEATNGRGWTPLHVAAKCGHVDVARLLLDRGMGWYWCDAALNLGIMQG